jgi:hypothetical protein
MKQPEALRLANSIISSAVPYPLELKCAAELRRQHALIVELVEALEVARRYIAGEGDDTECNFVCNALSKAKEQP